MTTSVHNNGFATYPAVNPNITADTSADIPAVSKVMRQMQELDAGVKNLATHIDRLIIRLQPVLHVPPADPNNAKEPTIPLCPLADSLLTQNRKILDLANVVASTIAHLEL